MTQAYNLSDGSETEGGSTKAQFDAVQRLLNMSKSYILQRPDLPSTDDGEQSK